MINKMLLGKYSEQWPNRKKVKLYYLGCDRMQHMIPGKDQIGLDNPISYSNTRS